MTQELEQARRSVVICLFCGTQTLVPAPVERRRFAGSLEEQHLASIIRCHLCGKEAVYLAEEIVEFEEPRAYQARAASR